MRRMTSERCLTAFRALCRVQGAAHMTDVKEIPGVDLVVIMLEEHLLDAIRPKKKRRAG